MIFHLAIALPTTFGAVNVISVVRDPVDQAPRIDGECLTYREDVDVETPLYHDDCLGR